MQEKIVRLTEKADFKAVVISDVHAHYEVLERLVAKLQLTPEDYLIILGDFINKGVDSLRTYEYIREIEKRDRTYIIKGNHEYMMGDWMKNKDLFCHWFETILKGFEGETIVHAMLKKHGRDINDIDDVEKLYNFLNDNYHDVFHYLRELPVVLHLGEHIFVHARYDDEFKLPEDEYKYLKYMGCDKMKENEQKVVVGHWPAANFYPDGSSNAPYVGYKNYIFIDGGMGVLEYGQLNAFIIEKIDGEVSYSHIT